jgi:hypothetical protein
MRERQQHSFGWFDGLGGRNGLVAQFNDGIDIADRQRVARRLAFAVGDGKCVWGADVKRIDECEPAHERLRERKLVPLGVGGQCEHESGREPDGQRVTLRLGVRER